MKRESVSLWNKGVCSDRQFNWSKARSNLEVGQWEEKRKAKVKEWWCRLSLLIKDLEWNAKDNVFCFVVSRSH